LIEDAYRTGEALGLPVWCTDQAGPFQTVPHPGPSWQPEGEPARQPHEYLRDGTAKVLTLFHPADGHVRVEGVTSCPNTVLHGWLKRELTAVLAAIPAAVKAASRGDWERWQQGLRGRPRTNPSSLHFATLFSSGLIMGGGSRGNAGADRLSLPM